MQYECILAQHEQKLRQCLQMVFMSMLFHIKTGIIIIIIITHKHMSQCETYKHEKKTGTNMATTLNCTMYTILI